jgi:hypothetical protein
MKLRLWLPKARPTLPRAILTGVGSAVAAAGLRLVLQPFIGEDLPLVTFFPALLIAAIWGGMTAALVCLGLGLGAYRALFPEYSGDGRSARLATCLCRLRRGRGMGRQRTRLINP